MAIGAKAWSFDYNILVPQNIPLSVAQESVEKWVAQTLRDRLDPKFGQNQSIIHSIVQVRFSLADFIPGIRFRMHGWCRPQSRTNADVLRAWLGIEFVGSKWVPHNGVDPLVDNAYKEWLSADAAADVSLDVWPAPGAQDRLLLQACADAGIDPRRVLHVRKPDPDSAALERFQAKGIELAAAGVRRGIWENPAGQKWVRLAIPGENQEQQYTEAARLFQPRDAGHCALSQPSKLSKVFRASADYSGVCVLAKALLGSGLSSYADGFEPSGQTQQQNDDFWIITCCSQTQTFHCCFRSPDQIIPIYMIRIIRSAPPNLHDRDGNFPAPAKLVDSFSVPAKDCTDSDIHAENTQLKIENAELVREHSVLKKKLARVRRTRRNDTNAAARKARSGWQAATRRATLGATAGPALPRFWPRTCPESPAAAPLFLKILPTICTLWNQTKMERQ